MKIVPVIDLKEGHVVAAHLGQRESYAPLNTPLCRSSAPLQVATALLTRFPFDTLYIADLDAISGAGSNFDSLRALHRHYPHITLWVDNGGVELKQLSAIARPVIGSESLGGLSDYTRLRSAHPSALLSLDFHEREFRGPPALLANPRLWPEAIIAMTLSRIGSDRGPDLTLLTELSARKPASSLYAAGGIRNRNDLHNLNRMGISGCLLASALHRGDIDSAALNGLLTPRSPDPETIGTKP